MERGALMRRVMIVSIRIKREVLSNLNTLINVEIWRCVSIRIKREVLSNEILNDARLWIGFNSHQARSSLQ